MARGRACDEDAAVSRITCPFGAAHGHGGAPIAFKTAIEQPEGIGNHARGAVVLECDGLGHERVTVQEGVLPAGHRHLAKVLDGGAVELHMPARHGCVELRGGACAHWMLELGHIVKLRHRVDAGTRLVAARHGTDVAAEGDQHMLTDPRRDGGSGRLQCHDRTGPAMRNDR